MIKLPTEHPKQQIYRGLTTPQRRIYCTEFYLMSTKYPNAVTKYTRNDLPIGPFVITDEEPSILCALPYAWEPRQFEGGFEYTGFCVRCDPVHEVEDAFPLDAEAACVFLNQPFNRENCTYNNLPPQIQERYCTFSAYDGLVRVVSSTDKFSNVYAGGQLYIASGIYSDSHYILDIVGSDPIIAMKYHGPDALSACYIFAHNKGNPGVSSHFLDYSGPKEAPTMAFHNVAGEYIMPRIDLLTSLIWTPPPGGRYFTLITGILIITAGTGYIGPIRDAFVFQVTRAESNEIH